MVERWPFPLGWLPGRCELQDSGGYTWKFKQHDEHSAFLSSLFSQPLWDAPRWWIKIRDRPPVCSWWSWCFFSKGKTSEPPVRSRQVQNAWTKLMHLWWHDFYIYQTYNLYEADLFGYFVKNSSKIMVTFKLSLWAQLHLFGQVMETDHPQETSIFDIFFGVLQFTTTTIRFLFMVLSCITMTKNMCISKKQL